MTTTRLPLFPLNTVLFPGLVLPLNVFEARYRALLRDLLDLPEGEPRPFGVIAIREGHEVAPRGLGLPDGPPADPDPAAGFGADPMRSFHQVGCVADASTIRPRPVPGEAAEAGERDGTATGYEVLATGTSRFRLLSVDASGPYLVGEVEPLEERPGEGAGALASGVLLAFRRYQKALAGANERTLGPAQDLPDDPSVVSYLVAAATVLHTSDKQRLLQAPDTASRLADELRLLRQEVALISKLPSVPGAEYTIRPTSLN
ncbi:LON peptidase substrate-binding domain-containing protein [Streptomyces sp. DSM 44915]|uniref:LON peptidase substrate-binding domain-containing protein n=1 Tax=Streptomyces chisholmiae TaxID=3075540 RepID=A0ABU2JKI0_9ACTN|nr:LON peptidase substrate-binding domain-containing protein [Streptomyces sp. DSM 44915]MDT0265009.1 LON peptidase substrate-binding domain-containing protein [Streptomyces sp. DSM 44915]